MSKGLNFVYTRANQIYYIYCVTEWILGRRALQWLTVKSLTNQIGNVSSRRQI